ncbi:phosphoribosylglycinamide formyltransferase [Anaerovorax sp. IOR16]|uniref:phosphoribosylglycinamide formyltransferase n=1 Tax=Anaerovorax sp. IOR16 TaxID=2773458 RepID=UPI0019D24775|nr:phosphoribosylglycinamide formyltransferase [Anaerovorax sp. IOR16]
MQKITVLVSGGGTNLQAIIDAITCGEIKNAKIVQVISSNSKAFSLERARKHGIAAKVIDKETYPDLNDRTDALIFALKEEDTDLVVLAGYMSVLDAKLIQAYEGRIINIHPSLIPKFCGKGFYGKRVHQAVLDAGETQTGATVHFVDEGVDTGEVILQESVPVLNGDTADILAARVLITEHKILIKAIKKLLEEKNLGGK